VPDAFVTKSLTILTIYCALLSCRLVDFKRLSAQTVEALMQWVPPPGVEMESSICTNVTGGNQLCRLQKRQADKAAMA